MGLFTGFLNGVANGVAPKRGAAKIEECCSQLGWGIDGRVGDGGIVLNFNCPLAGIRPVLVTTSDDIGSITTSSLAKFSPHDLPVDLGYLLLLRNNKNLVCGAWEITQEDNNKVGFLVGHVVLLGGLTAAYFKVICEGLVKEVIEVDQALRGKGLI